MYKNYYIALEGLDGSGKSTLFKKLVEYLDLKQIKYSTVCPTCCFNNSLIERINKNYKNLSNNTMFRAILFAYRSFLASKKTNWKADIIIGDRSIITSYVTRWKKWFNSAKFTIFFVNLMEPFIPAPSFILYIDAEHDVIQKRLSTRKELDVDETPRRSLEMRKAYKEIEQYEIYRLRNTKWLKINGNLSINEVVSQLIEAVEQIPV